MDKDGKPRIIDVMKAFDVVYPKITKSDPLSMTQALQLQAANGWVDNETAMGDLGRDPARTRKRLERERAEETQHQTDEQPSTFDV